MPKGIREIALIGLIFLLDAVIGRLVVPHRSYVLTVVSFGIAGCVIAFIARKLTQNRTIAAANDPTSVVQLDRICSLNLLSYAPKRG